MAPSIQAAPPTPAEQRNIVPAVPLLFMKKRKEDNDTTRNKKLNGIQIVNGHTNHAAAIDAKNEPSPPTVNDSRQAEEPPRRGRHRETLRVVTKTSESQQNLTGNGASKQVQGK